jgi:membrane protease YdiL (CAAX protease family)
VRDLQSFAGRRPIVFAVVSTVAWFTSALVCTGIASSMLGRPCGDAATVTIGRVAAVAFVALVLWRLQWLRVSGVTRPGTWQIWLIAVAGTVYAAAASLYSLFGSLAPDLSSVLQRAQSRSTVTSHLVAALSEETLFRGLVLYVLIRAWGNRRRGAIGSAVVASLLFAVLHLTQVLTYGVSLSSASLLTVQTFIVAIWWAALVLRSGSIWPAVFAHFVVNAMVALQQLTTPIIGNESVVYARLLAFSLLLGVLGIAMLARAPLRSRLPEAQGVETSERGSEQ